MVRVIIILILTHSFFVCIGQKRYPANKIELKASFNCEKANMEDSLKLYLYYRNMTDDTFKLFPKAILGLGHNDNAFITYDKPERIGYILNLFTDYDSIVSLKPGEELRYTFNIVADSNFFYEGKNEVYVYYHLFYKPLIGKRQRMDKRKPVLSLWSSPIKIYVSSKNCSLKKYPASGH